MDWERDWDGRPIYYDRQGKPMTVQQWAQRFEDEDYRHIARDVIGPDQPLDPAPLITVSTFWLGLNHDWRSDEPLIYETIIIGGGTTRPVCDTRRRSRRGKAIEGRSTICAPAAVRVVVRRRWPREPVRKSLRPLSGKSQEVGLGRMVRFMPGTGESVRSSSLAS